MIGTRNDKVRRMRFHRGSVGALALGSALALSSCSTKDRGATSGAAQSQPVSTTPARWEPVDKSFTGCAGG